MKINLLLLILFMSLLFNGGNIMAGESNQSSWIQPWRESTVALGIVGKLKNRLPNGKVLKQDAFIVVGTGIIVGANGKVPWLVTAKHVFYNPEQNWNPEVIYLRFAWFEDRSVFEYLGIPIRLKEKGDNLWISHPKPDVDLAAIPLKISKKLAGRDKCPGITFDSFVNKEDIYEGAAVIVFGYPGAVGPLFWKRAMARSGIISWFDSKHPTKHSILIDSMLFPGNSGGPVFKIPSGMNKTGSFVIGGTVKLIGLVSQTRYQETAVLADNKEITINGPQGSVKIVSKQAIGIGIIEPAIRIKEMLPKQ